MLIGSTEPEDELEEEDDELDDELDELLGLGSLTEL